MTDERPPPVGELCDQMQDSVFVVAEDGRVVFANERLLAAGGLEREAVIGAPADVLAAVTEEGFERFESALEELLGGADVDERRVEVVVSSASEGALPLELRLTPLNDGGVLVVMRDVSERRAYEAELERKTEQLAVLNRLLRHDIRNDANVITGWSRQLADELDEGDRDAIEHVREAASHIVELTHEARDVQAIIDEEGAMSRSPIQLDRVLREEVEKTRGMHPEATVTVRGEVPSVAVEANELLGSVFANLLNNAVVHNDGDAPRVEVRVDRTDDAVTVAVADDGPGVPPERREDLLDRDEQALESSGSGMGLYIVGTLLAEFDGDVAVGDAALGGAEFTVRLPVADGG